ncbi:HlyD family secretion protein [Caulobacter segnis]|uniref:HlyD family secretion protein n=1 Tax=Caulobacter segnis TaxID=88688 RepID=UPI001CBB43C3|nr:HlyD family secretion protein [Caulobacter segnis]UAL10184.1 HlyD family secretion protein [Caulobacter segnis]
MTDAALDEPAHVWRPRPRPPWLVIGIVLIGLIAVLLVLNAWKLPPFGSHLERTENAYVRGRTTVIAPQVSGYVAQVLVRDYEVVKAGQLLVRIDDATYVARLAQARANLAAQEAALANSRQAHAARTAGLEGQVANLGNARAQLLRAQADMRRANDLVGDGSISVRERDQTLAALRQAEAQVRQAMAGGEIARQDVRTVDVGRGGLEAQVEAARAQVRMAEIDLAHTQIVAPESGQLGEVGVRLGQFVTNGTQLVALVPAQRWVIANFKERQTAHMIVGQPARLYVDALGGARLSGRIERISPAAGSEFSVLKPDNATGNFVKVPQRIGVRIVIDPNQDEAARLRPGLSVEAEVDTRGRP